MLYFHFKKFFGNLLHRLMSVANVAIATGRKVLGTLRSFALVLEIKQNNIEMKVIIF